MPLEVGEGLAGVGVPDPRRLVRGGDDPLAVGAERGGVDHVGVPLEVGEVLPESASQTRAVLSPEAVTIRLPSGLNAAEWTDEVCPWREARGLPESASQTRAVLSAEAVTIRLPSGLNAAVWTVGVPLEGGDGLAGVGVPDPRRGVA